MLSPRSRTGLCLVLLASLTITLTTGCGGSAVPDGGQINATIPKEEAVKQNDAYKNYSKSSKKGKPPGM